MESYSYDDGAREAWKAMLRRCLQELGETHDPAVRVAKLVAERVSIVWALRSACAELGDNDWEPSLPLADVIDKHLVRHLARGNFDPDPKPTSELDLLYRYEEVRLAAEGLGLRLAATREDFVLRDTTRGLQVYARCTSVAAVEAAIERRREALKAP